MTFETALVLAVLILTSCITLIGVATLRSLRMRIVYAALGAILFGVNVLWLLGKELQSFSMDLLSVSSTILVYPAATILVLAFFHGRRFVRNIPLQLAIFIPTLAIIVESWVEGWTSSNLYGYPLLSIYAIACLGISIGESASYWLGSNILRAEGYLLVLSLVVLLATGPVYYLEMRFLNAENFLGPNFGLPLFAALVLVALLRTDHRCPRRRSRTSRHPGVRSHNLETGRIHFMSETRPKYAGTVFADLVRSGRPGLALISSSKVQFEERLHLSEATVVEVSFQDRSDTIRPSDLSRLHFVVRDFAESQRGSVVLLEAFPRIVCNNEIRSVKEFAILLRRLARNTSCTCIVPKSLMSEVEFSQIARTKDSLMEFPDVEDRVLRILNDHVGDLSWHLLRTFCMRRDIAVKDLLLEDIPDLANWVARSLDSLGVYAGDAAVLRRWGTESGRITEELLSYRASNLDDAQQLVPNPRRRPEQDFSPVLYDGTKGSPVLGKDEEQASEAEEVEDRLLRVFSEHLGEAGKSILTREVRRLGKSLSDVTLEDVAGIAKRAEEIMVEFGNIVDVVEVRTDMERKGHIMKEEIIGIMADGA